MAPPPRKRRRDLAQAVAPAGALLSLRPAISPASACVMSSRVTTRREAPRRRDRIVLLHRHGVLYLRVLRHLLARPSASRRPFSSPSDSPEKRPRRRSLPVESRGANVRDFHFEQRAPPPAFTWILLASGATSKHSVRSASFLPTPFSVTMGRLDYFVNGHFASASPSFRAAASDSSTCGVRQQIVDGDVAWSAPASRPARLREPSARLRFSFVVDQQHGLAPPRDVPSAAAQILGLVIRRA